tara:strand:+ start:621 stop:794 length:174 start_codon:yes stop_codon:yes gene_type:complete
MCEKAYCRFIEIIEINDEGDKIYMHYKEDEKSPFYIQFFGATDLKLLSFETTQTPEE